MKNKLPIFLFFTVLISDITTKILFTEKFFFNIDRDIKDIIIPLIFIILIVIIISKTEKLTIFIKSLFWIIIAGNIGDFIYPVKIFTIKNITFLPSFNISQIAVAISFIIMITFILIKQRR